MEELIELDQISGRLFAVGDIHGCPDELERLIDHLVTKESLNTDDRVIFIGDYIDRGSGSRDVIDFLLDFSSDNPNTVFLRGNHEDMLLDFLGLQGSLGDVYLDNGGVQTLLSYEIDALDPGAHVAEAFPEDHLEFFESLLSVVETEDYVFAHAGVNPLRDLKAQLADDLYWIRDPFIENIHYFQKPVVFGHTVFHTVFFHLPYKIGIDTGLVYGNRLSCLNFTEKKMYQIRRERKRIRTRDFPRRNSGRRGKRLF